MELKFRAWDKHRKNMVQPNDGDFIGWHAMSNWRECLEVMQFTGLHDKHGKEIYEGDIMKLSDAIFVSVGFNEETGAFNAGESDHLYGAEHSEVVGNIYESPELLEDPNPHNVDLGE